MLKQRTITPRKVLGHREIHDGEQAELATLELIPMESLSEHKRTLLTAKIAKIKLKVNLYIAKIALQSEAAQAKKIRTNFERIRGCDEIARC